MKMISNGLKYLKAIFFKFFSLHTDSIIFPSKFFFFKKMNIYALPMGGNINLGTNPFS